MKRTLFSLVLMLGLMMPAANQAMAQPTATDQTFVSEISGEEVDLGTSGNITFIEENYDFRESVSFQEEYIWFTTGWSNFQLVMIGGPNESQDYHDVTLENMEVFYDSWELIDENITDDHSWFLGEGELDSGSLIVYYEFELDAFGETDLVVMQFTDASTFQNDLETAQSEVTIGGEPLLPETDAADLVELVGYETGTPDASPDTDDVNETETDRSRSTRGGTDDDADAPEDDDSDSGVTRTSRGGTDDDADASDDEESDTGVTRTTRGGSDEPDDEDIEDEGDDDSGRSRSDRGGTADVEDDEDASTSRTSRTTQDDDDETTNESETGSSSRVGRLGDTISTDPDDDVADDSTPAPDVGLEDMGLISDTEWESPSHGNTITWDGTTWELPDDFEYVIVVNEDPPYDIITLQTTDGLGYVYLTVDQAYEATPASMVEYWVTDEYTDQLVGDVTVLDTGTTANSATMVYETTNAIDQPLISVLEATFLDDGTVIFSQISGAPESIDFVYEQFVDGVEVDGAPLDMTFTVEDIRDISGN